MSVIEAKRLHFINLSGLRNNNIYNINCYYCLADLRQALGFTPSADNCVWSPPNLPRKPQPTPPGDCDQVNPFEHMSRRRRQLVLHCLSGTEAVVGTQTSSGVFRGVIRTPSSRTL